MSHLMFHAAARATKWPSDTAGKKRVANPAG